MVVTSPYLILLAAVASVHAAAPYCLAGQECFPSAELLTTFNETVGGALIKVEPYGSPCYKATYDEAECKRLATVKKSNEFRQSLPAGVMYTNFEMAGTEGCLVPDLPTDGSAPAAVDKACTIGNMPSYVVNAASANDVVESVKFAREHNLRLRSGHDYSGRSSGAGALSIWTRHLNDAEAKPGFVPDGCRVKPHDAVSAGPGLNVEELYAWGAQNGQITIGGYTTTVGATGGYILGGGLGPLVPHLGMGVDTDGTKKIANECTNQDLFWAMRGGGGAFAVATRVWLKAYPALEGINVAAGPVGCRDRESYSRLISALIDEQGPLRQKGHTGIWQASGGQLGILLISMESFFAGETPRSAADTLADLDALKVDGCTSRLKGSQFLGSTSFNDAYQGVIWPTAEPGSIVGINLHDVSRLVSNSKIASSTERQKIKDLIFNLLEDLPFIWQNNVGNATAEVPADATSVHPEWRDAFSFVNLPIFGPWQGQTKEQNQTTLDIMSSSAEVFSNAAYYNEHIGFEQDWQDTLFGANYKRLLEIKKSVDPKGLFSCPLCVGSEDGF